jgi:hypothetical protein
MLVFPPWYLKTGRQRKEAAGIQRLARAPGLLFSTWDGLTPKSTLQASLVRIRYTRTLSAASLISRKASSGWRARTYMLEGHTPIDHGRRLVCAHPIDVHC